MVAGYDWFSPTRMAGVGSYAITCAVCLMRWRQAGSVDHRARIFGWLALVQLALLLDMAFDWRWKLHDWWVGKAIALHVYDLRRGPQVLALWLLVLLLAFSQYAIWNRSRNRVGAALAAGATVGSVAICCCEWVSYHDVDAILYRMAGPWMLVSFVWIGLAVLTCAGARIDGAANR